LEPDLIANLLANAATPELWLEAMSALTLQRADPRQDNYSAIACWVGEAIEVNQADSATASATSLPRSQLGHADAR